MRRLAAYLLLAHSSTMHGLRILSPNCATALRAGQRWHRELDFVPPPLVAALRDDMGALSWRHTHSVSSDGTIDNLRSALTCRPSMDSDAFAELFDRLQLVREEVEPIFLTAPSLVTPVLSPTNAPKR